MHKLQTSPTRKLYTFPDQGCRNTKRAGHLCGVQKEVKAVENS